MKYDKVKKVIDNREERYVIELTRYDPDTGEAKMEEHMVDPDLLKEREGVLAKEVDIIKTLRGKIQNGNFDKIEDKRSAKNESS